MALVSAAPPGALAIRAIAQTVPQFFEPCFEWGGTSVTSPSCGGTSETKQHAIVRLLLFPGGMLFGVALGVYATARLSSGIAVAAAVVMYAASLPFALTFAILSAFPSAAMLLVARFAGPPRGATKVTMRVLGAVAGLMGLDWIWIGTRAGVPLLLGIVVLLHAAIAAAAWWPARPSAA